MLNGILFREANRKSQKLFPFVKVVEKIEVYSYRLRTGKDISEQTALSETILLHQDEFD